MGGRTVKKDDSATFTLYDAGLFFVFLIIASSLITVNTLNIDSEIDQRRIEAKYCENGRSAFLTATIPSTGYNHEGKDITRKDLSVRALLLEQIYLEKNGVPRENFSYPSDIAELGNKQFGDEWALKISPQNHDDLRIYSHGTASSTQTLKNRLGDDMISSSWEEDGLSDKKVEITFYHAA